MLVFFLPPLASGSSGTIVAVDGNKKLIDAACEMARERQVTVRCPSVAGSSVEQEVHLPSDANPSRVSFLQCDPMRLPTSLTGKPLVGDAWATTFRALEQKNETKEFGGALAPLGGLLWITRQVVTEMRRATWNVDDDDLDE